MLFANVFFQTKPIVQALDPDTHIWEDAKIEGFEGTNHVRVNFTRWGKNKDPVRVLFCDPQVDLELWPIRKAVKEVLFSRRHNIDYKLDYTKEKFEKGDAVHYVGSTAPSVGDIMEPREMKQMIQEASILKSGTVLIKDRFRKTLLICSNEEKFYISYNQLRNSDWQKEGIAEAEENIPIPVAKKVKVEVKAEEKGEKKSKKNISDILRTLCGSEETVTLTLVPTTNGILATGSRVVIDLSQTGVVRKLFFDRKEAQAIAEVTLDGSKRYIGLPVTDVRLSVDPNQSIRQQQEVNYMKYPEITEKRPNLHPVDEIFTVFSAIKRELFLSYDTINHTEIIYSPVPFYIKQVLGCESSRDSVSI